MTENFISFTILFLNILVEIIYWIMIAYILLSWFIRRPNPFWNWLNSLVQPILKPFRWARIGMIDFSPIAALFILDILKNVLVNLLLTLLPTA